MANLANAKKAIRTQARKTEINARLKSQAKRLVKETRKLASAGDSKAATAKLSEATKALDKASRRYMHKNKAARLKSRLAKQVNAIEK